MVLSLGLCLRLLRAEVLVAQSAPGPLLSMPAIEQNLISIPVYNCV